MILEFLSIDSRRSRGSIRARMHRAENHGMENHCLVILHSRLHWWIVNEASIRSVRYRGTEGFARHWSDES